MRAVVKSKREDGNTAVEDVPVPEPGPDDVLIKVAYIGICGSDPHMFHNQVSYAMALPIILGHEFAGTVEKVGANVKDWKPGDRVTAETHASFCGKCLMCRTNNHRFCRERNGFGVLANGAYAEYLRAHQRIVHRLPEAVSLRDGACVEPLCVAYNVTCVKTPVAPGDSVVIIGPGGIGLLCCRLAALAGAKDVVVVGGPGDEERLKTAMKFGATATVPAGGDAMGEARKMNGGYGADVVIDAAGPAATLKLAIEMVRPDGKINKVAWGPKPIDFSLDSVIGKGVTLQGSFSHTWDIWEKVIGLMAAGAIDFDRFVTHELPLEEWRKGFELVESRKGLKVLLKP